MKSIVGTRTGAVSAGSQSPLKHWGQKQRPKTNAPRSKLCRVLCPPIKDLYIVLRGARCYYQSQCTAVQGPAIAPPAEVSTFSCADSSAPANRTPRRRTHPALWARLLKFFSAPSCPHIFYTLYWVARNHMDKSFQIFHRIDENEWPRFR